MLITYDGKPSRNLRASHLDCLYLKSIGWSCNRNATNPKKVTIDTNYLEGNHKLLDCSKLPSSTRKDCELR